MIPLLRPARLGLVLFALALRGLAQESLETDLFRVHLDPGNAWLPTSLVWKTAGRELPLIDADQGLNLTFTDFQFRNKFYREENRRIWGDAADPRFTVEPREATVAPTPDPEAGFSGVDVTYRHPLGTVVRRLLLHRTEPRLRIEYRIAVESEILVHEPEMLAVQFLAAPGFTTGSRPAIEEADAPLLVCTNLDRGRYAVSLLPSGPMRLADPAAGVALLLDGQAASDSLSNGIPTRLAVLTPGDRLVIRLDVRAAAANDPSLDAALRAQTAALPERFRPFRLVATARLLQRMGRLDDAVRALLRAGELDPAYATPYAALAGLRRDTGADLGMTEQEAWVEGAYRMPYNYGYILSGGGLASDRRLSETQRRLGMMNLLIAVENTVFYPDYYVWAARPFEAMGLRGLACALYRQALWAVDYMPRSDATKARLRKQFQDKIETLSQTLLTERAPTLPPLTPVRVAPETSRPDR